MRKMIYFNGINDLNELRKLYYKLAQQHHPDKGGDLAIMQIINAEYAEYSAWLIAGNTNFSEARKTYETEVSEELMNKVNEILHLENVIIEIIGGWIWISGDTYPVRKELKELKFMFSRNKTAWYWHQGYYRKNNGKFFDLDEIRDMWGSQQVKNKPRNNKKSYSIN